MTSRQPEKTGEICFLSPPHTHQHFPLGYSMKVSDQELVREVRLLFKVPVMTKSTSVDLCPPCSYSYAHFRNETSLASPSQHPSITQMHPVPSLALWSLIKCPFVTEVSPGFHNLNCTTLPMCIFIQHFLFVYRLRIKMIPHIHILLQNFYSKSSCN